MWLMVDPELVISDVLAGMKYLSEIQFPEFPERGLGRDRIAELYSARKVSPLYNDSSADGIGDS